MQPRPHDLLFARSPSGFAPCGDAPGWLEPDWMARAPLVVRRAPDVEGRIPVGLRGRRRKERCAGFLERAGVALRVQPETLAAALLAGPGLAHASGADAHLPCVAALLDLAPRLAALELDWGPVGGVGFWLASGLPVLRPDSDLDLLVRAPRPPSQDAIDALSALQAAYGCRIDVQLDNGRGGFALAEYARGGRVLLKTDDGPLLVDDPWHALEPA